MTRLQNLANFEALAFIAAVMRYDFKWATEEQGQTSPWPPTYGISLTHPVVSLPSIKKMRGLALTLPLCPPTEASLRPDRREACLAAHALRDVLNKISSSTVRLVT